MFSVMYSVSVVQILCFCKKFKMYIWGKDMGRHNQGLWDRHYTLLYLKWITNKEVLYSTENSARCYVAVWIEGEFGKK